MSVGSDLPSLLADSLKQMSTATKAVAFYPGQHPSVVAALDRASTALKETLAGHEEVRLGILDAGFVLGAEPIAPGDPALSGFAAYLSRRGIGAIRFRPPVQEAAIRGFLEVIALDPGALRSRAGPANCLRERNVEGVSIDDLDLTAVMKTARTDGAPLPGDTSPGTREKRATASWGDLLSRFLIGDAKDCPPGGEHLLRRVAGDAGAAKELMASLQAASRDRGNRGALVASALQRVAANIASAEPEALEALTANLAAAMTELDPQARLDVLHASIPVPGTGLDLAREVRARIPDEAIADLVISLVQTEGSVNPRLGTVIRKVLSDKGGSEAERENVLNAIRSARRPGDQPAPDVLKTVEDLLQESQDDWISREYKGLLELIGAGAPALDEATRQALLGSPGFQDSLTPEGISMRAWMQYGDLLAIDEEPARQWMALDQIARRASGIRPEWFGGCGEAAAQVRARLEAAPAPQPHVREAASKALRSISENLLKAYRTSFHQLTAAHREAFARALDGLGGLCVEDLLLALATEEDWEIRKTFIPFLAARGRAALPALLGRLADPSWYVVRNILIVLGEIADPSTIPAIAPCLKHAEPRVRRDAAAALGKVGGPRAFALLSACLDDPEVAEVAMRALAAIDRPRTVGTFLQRTARPNAFGRGQKQLKEAIAFLGVLGASESVPHLEAILRRRFWIPPSAGDPVRIAAARALEKIGTAAALRAVEQGARAWRWPVRTACEEIVGGRRAGGAAIPSN